MHHVLSCYEAAELLRAREQGLTRVSSTTDLGRSKTDFELDERGARAGTELELDWSVVEQIAETDSVCFAVESGEAAPIRAYSEESGRTFQLWPTEGAPALLISGFVMHRVRDVGPFEGAERMVRALGTVRGRLLDTTTGLGYAAIAASRTAQEVVTIEVEPAVRDIARMNPWSRELFEKPNLRLLLGDSSEVVKTLEAGSFSAVLHDPPAINLAGELYSAEFYADVRRLLTRNGKFFHYIGDPESASGGRTTRGVVKRLRDAGFSRVSVRAEAFGVLAVP
jgi:predicted methyltransferase